MNTHDARKLSIASCVSELLFQIEGKACQRPGLEDTPRRVAQAYEEWFAGYAQDPMSVFKTFEDGAENCNELVILERVPVASFCEHHMAPWIGHATVGYIPNGRIVGLSKIPRLVDIFAKRLQVQERFTNQIVDAMMQGLEPKGAGVIVRAEHMCMSTRGVHKPGIITTTSALRGAFMKSAEVRAEFLALRNK